MDTLKTCPACNAMGGRILVPGKYVAAKQDVYRCPQCRTAFFLTRQAEPDYWQATGQEDAYADHEADAGLLFLHDRALDELDQLIPARDKNTPRRLLDVGCGEGLFLQRARECTPAWAAEGLEASPRGAELAEQRSGCPVRVGIAEDLTAADGAWDVICLWDVIEHLPHPARTVAALAARLTPGGLLALRTPNEGSAFRALARGARWGSGGLFGGLLKYVYYHPHYVTFTAAGLAAVAAQAGLQPERTRFEETPIAFAREKIRAAYQKYPGHQLVIAALPLAYLVGRIGGQNKIVFYARQPMT